MPSSQSERGYAICAARALVSLIPFEIPVFIFQSIPSAASAHPARPAVTPEQVRKCVQFEGSSPSFQSTSPFFYLYRWRPSRNPPAGPTLEEFGKVLCNPHYL